MGQPVANVLLLSMPWTSIVEPSLGLAILKAKLLQAGIRVRVRHCSPFLLEYFKFDSYQAIAERFGINDFLFTAVLEGAAISPEQIEALHWVAHNRYSAAGSGERGTFNPATFVEYLCRARNEAIPKFLEDCMRVVDEVKPTMVGFTCLFDQTIPSLALAKLIKQRHPGTLVVFGGYALEDPVGAQIARCFPFVDVVVQGEGEDRVIALANASINRPDLKDIQGIHYRNEGGNLSWNPRSSHPVNLDESPFPDFDDFYGDIQELRSNHAIDVEVATLPVESSRGCWWGQIHHCVFCGIDDQTMKYRCKSPEHVEKMLEHMHAKYGDVCFRFSDYILPRTYYKTLLPRLASSERKYKLHWEMKANVKAEEVLLMKHAGIITVQPGIESFSTPVLRAMDKGISGIQNVLTIKLLMESDIVVHYNILFGFPDDRPEDYEELVRKIPLLYHLPPPYSLTPILITRFSPLHSNPIRFGIHTPSEAQRDYETMFSPPFRRSIGFDLNNYAYSFKTPYAYDPGCAHLYSVLAYQVLNWTQMHINRPVELSYRLTNSGIMYRDSRYQEEPQVMEFGPVHGELQKIISDKICAVGDLKRSLSDRPVEDVSRALEELDAARLIFTEGERVVGLALPLECYNRRRATTKALEEQLEIQRYAACESSS